MKILIYGAGSYIGNHYRDALIARGHDVKCVDAIKVKPANVNLDGIDSVIDVAGIAHIKITPDMEDLFYRINTNLAIDLCKEAKANGVRQFIYMSSMNVFGDTHERISSCYQEKPKNFYGKSKLLADKGIQSMATPDFKVVSVRPPVVYGKGCKGNFALLIKLSKYLPIFPYFSNTKSVIFIDNLCNFICEIIENQSSGVFHPQNAMHTSIVEIIKNVRAAMGKKTLFVHGFGWIIKVLMKLNHKVERVFANDYYDLEFSKYKNNSYCSIDFEESIKRTV